MPDVDASGWTRIPVEGGQGYIESSEILSWSDSKLLEVIQAAEKERYQGHRNWNNLWRSTLGLDTTHGKRILDFGCGFGLEALQFCKSGNDVVLSDIHPTNVKVAERVLAVSGYRPAETGTVDVWYANGVLHHTPRMREILESATYLLNPGGEIRLLLYSDRAWTEYSGAPLPAIDDDVRRSPASQRYLRAMDQVGEYADWYNREKLERKVGDFLDVYQFNYIMQSGIYATAILRPRG